ncbi:MAG: hypothetical protein MPEBLZ_01393, partial [Candidatus Methanoperedens nitroreducens]
EELLRMMTACLAPTAPTLVIMGNEDPGFKGINKTLTGQSNPEAIWGRGLGCGEGGEGFNLLCMSVKNTPFSTTRVYFPNNEHFN